MTADRRVVLLTGLSGAGKTTATKSLEDIGFRTIDNLPHELLPALVEKIAADPQRFARVCLVLDARDGDPSQTIELVRTGTAAIGVSARIIYLDARDDVLIRRFSETRHRHPLGGAVDAPRSVADAIAAERMLLSATRESADAVIDTSDLSGRELRDRLVAEALESDERVALSRVGLVTSAKLRAWRRGAIVGVVIVSAIATPGTDLVSPLVLAITLLLLYEFSIILVRAGGR